ncbi:DUF4870 family protein [Rhodospirillum sp. A1_3_36]|uniref:DUF4870 family protein n=1 Tax=Rhodospirillum sp. A1_3_36 TaxID=3391666 RepID=UPI0039A72BE4
MSESSIFDMMDNPNPPEPEGARTMVQVIYALYVVSFFYGITSVFGLTMAYLKRGDYTGTIYADHLTWLIRTFWFSILFSLISLAIILSNSLSLAYLMMGMTMGFWYSLPGAAILILCFTVIWFIYRVFKGMFAISKRKGFSNPKSFF